MSHGLRHPSALTQADVDRLKATDQTVELILPPYMLEALYQWFDDRCIGLVRGPPSEDPDRLPWFFASPDAIGDDA